MKIVISLILLGTIANQESLANKELYHHLQEINQYAEENFNRIKELKNISNTALASYQKTQELSTQLRSCQREQQEHLTNKQTAHQQLHQLLISENQLNSLLGNFKSEREKLTKELTLKNKQAEEAYKKIVSLESHRKPTSLFGKFLAMFKKLPEPSPQDLTNIANVWSQSATEATSLKQQILELDSKYKKAEQELFQNTQLKNQYFQSNKKIAAALNPINANLKHTELTISNELNTQENLSKSLQKALESFLH